MAKGPSRHRPVFHLLVLCSGFVAGGLMAQLARRFLPPGAVKEFLTDRCAAVCWPVADRPDYIEVRGWADRA